MVIERLMQVPVECWFCAVGFFVVVLLLFVWCGFVCLVFFSIGDYLVISKLVGNSKREWNI